MSLLSRLSNTELVQSMRGLLATHRRNTASIVEHLAEMDRRHLAVEAGYTSLFAYCTQALGFTSDEAYRRIEAARITLRFPATLTAIADGSISLTVLALLKPHLIGENCSELLELVRNATVQSAKELIAARFPRPDVPASIRKVPEVAHDSTPEPERTHGRLDPLSQDRFALKVTISRAIKDDLELARDLMRHRLPDGDIETVIGNALKLLVKRLRAEKFGETARPHKQPASRATHDPSPSRNARQHVPNATRREVVQREGLGCDFVGRDGHRCGAVAFLELDHETPVGLGGGPEASNIRQRCRAHNQLEAERAYGKGYMTAVGRKFEKSTGHIATREP